MVGTMKVLITVIFLTFLSSAMGEERTFLPSLNVKIDHGHICRHEEFRHIFANIVVKNISNQSQSITAIRLGKNKLFIQSHHAATFNCPADSFCTKRLPITIRWGNNEEIIIMPGQTRKFIVKVVTWKGDLKNNIGDMVIGIYGSDGELYVAKKKFHYSHEPECVGIWRKLIKL